MIGYIVGCIGCLILLSTIMIIGISSFFDDRK